MQGLNTENTNMMNNGASGQSVVSLMKMEQDREIAKVNSDMQSNRSVVLARLQQTGEIQRLSDELSVDNPQTIVEFGKHAADELSKTSDMVLRHYDLSVVNKTGQMMGMLSNLMDKIDIKEIQAAPEKKKGLLGIFKQSLENRLNAFVSKYNTIGGEIEKICVELKTFQNQIEVSNRDLDVLYDASIDNYKQLVAYIAAGEHALDEIDKFKSQLDREIEAGDREKLMVKQEVEQAENLLQQRLQDLRASESIALQSLPILKSMEYGNYNLSRKINTAFLVTLPAFKSAIAQAVIAKQQMVQAQALKALDDKTNEMIMRNAQTAADQMKLTAELAGSQSIKMETIEKSWETIMNGIRDTKQLNDELAKQRELDKARLNQINNQSSNIVAIGN